jgi:hypothetical protein
MRRLTADALTRVLVDYCLQLTVSARAYFLEGNFERARQSNETIHRVLGFVATQLTTGKGQAESMIDLVVADAVHNGWLFILRSVLDREIVARGMQEDQK